MNNDKKYAWSNSYNISRLLENIKSYYFKLSLARVEKDCLILYLE